MKTSTFIAVATGAALAAAQLDQIPTCALSCAITSISTSGCAQTDIACICSASTFLSGILSCIQGSCTAAEIEKTLGASQVLCASAGVTITLPGAAPSTTTTAPPPSSTSEAPEPTTEPETTEATESTSSTMEPAPTTESTTGVITLTTYTTVCPTSTTIVPTYVPPAQNTTVSPPPPAYTGAAGSIAANAGTVLFGAALAMFFA